jgi:hypothetical protein
MSFLPPLLLLLLMRCVTYTLRACWKHTLMNKQPPTPLRCTSRCRSRLCSETDQKAKYGCERRLSSSQSHTAWEGPPSFGLQEARDESKIDEKVTSLLLSVLSSLLLISALSRPCSLFSRLPFTLLTGPPSCGSAGRTAERPRAGCPLRPHARLRISHAWVSPSRFLLLSDIHRVCASEGWGLPLLEASLMGLPLIVTDWGGSTHFTTRQSSRLSLSSSFFLLRLLVSQLSAQISRDASHCIHFR